MVLFTRGQAYQQIQEHRKWLRTWTNLFDSSMTVEQFIQHEHNSTDPKYRCPAWDSSYRCNFRKDTRLFFAMDFWRTFPESLRKDVDQFEGLFPDLRYDYGGLEDQYFFVHRRACEYLVDVAEAEGFEGVAISAAGDNCRLIIKSLQDRRRLWEDSYTIGDWPDCHPHRLELPADIRQSLSAGQATLDLLRSLLGRWRCPKSEPESPATVLDSTKPIWDSESSTLRFNGEVIRTVRPIAKWRGILDTFHDDNWAPRIDNPLNGQSDLSSAVMRLNKGLSKIRFRRDDSGEGIMWEITGQ